jgi:spoIIIJ-associated protein
MNALAQAHQITENLLGYLGFYVTIEEEPDSPDGPTLQILTDESDALIGTRGEVLDDIQYLVNRLLIRRIPNAERIRVDVEFHRSMHEDKMLSRAKELASQVRKTGKPIALPPLNSYYRRLIHNAFVNDPEIQSESAPGDDRFKRVTLRLRSRAQR